MLFDKNAVCKHSIGFSVNSFQRHRPIRPKTISDDGLTTPTVLEIRARRDRWNDGGLCLCVCGTDTVVVSSAIRAKADSESKAVRDDELSETPRIRQTFVFPTAKRASSVFVFVIAVGRSWRLEKLRSPRIRSARYVS